MLYQPSASTTAPHGDAERLLRFNCELLDQALALVAAHEEPGAPAYSIHVGPHLRHVIEHYEALVFRADEASVDYDRRPRDRELERDTALARSRLLALKQQLSDWPDTWLGAPLHVHGQGGSTGEFNFATVSSIGRELVFLSSHATHHYALLQVLCQQQGIATDPRLGLAPATVAHGLGASTDSNPSHLMKERACSALQSAA